jgi:hypothetical protein
VAEVLGSYGYSYPSYPPIQLLLIYKYHNGPSPSRGAAKKLSLSTGDPTMQHIEQGVPNQSSTDAPSFPEKHDINEDPQITKDEPAVLDLLQFTTFGWVQSYWQLVHLIVLVKIHEWSRRFHRFLCTRLSFSL